MKGTLFCSAALLALAARAHAEDPPQIQPALSQTPAIAHGYQFAPDVRIGALLSWQRDRRIDDVPIDDISTELRFDWRAPLVGDKWLASVRFPVLTVLASEPQNERDLDAKLGNLQFTLTRVTETKYNAEAFIGLLVPAFSIGVVIPTGTRPESAPVPSRHFDALALYRPDTAALSVATHLRLDFFLFHGAYLQTSPELQVLDTGDVLLMWNTGLGFGLGSSGWLYRHVRFVFEHTWVRELGDDDFLIPPTTPGTNRRAGVRNVLRYGALLEGKKLGVTVSGNHVYGDSALSPYPTLEVHYAF